MSHKDPNDLLKDFSAVLDEVRSESILSPSDRQRIANSLGEVYNYVSASVRKPSFINALHAATAQNEKKEGLWAKERKTLLEHQQFVENCFDKAEQYLRSIQLGGYAVFFALWTLGKEWLSPFWGSVAAVFMIFSASSFVIWEVYKATLLVFILKRNASICSEKVEEFVRTRMAKLLQERSGVLALTQSRATVWCISILSAVAGTCVLLWQLLVSISHGFVH